MFWVVERIWTFKTGEMSMRNHQKEWIDDERELGLNWKPEKNTID